VDQDPNAYKGKGKAKSFAADPLLFPCQLSDNTLAKVGTSQRVPVLAALPAALELQRKQSTALF
jgi:hypothetical protein